MEVIGRNHMVSGALASSDIQSLVSEAGLGKRKKTHIDEASMYHLRHSTYIISFNSPSNTLREFLSLLWT